MNTAPQSRTRHVQRQPTLNAPSWWDAAFLAVAALVTPGSLVAAASVARRRLLRAPRAGTCMAPMATCPSRRTPCTLVHSFISLLISLLFPLLGRRRLSRPRLLGHRRLGRAPPPSSRAARRYLHGAHGYLPFAENTLHFRPLLHLLAHPPALSPATVVATLKKSFRDILSLTFVTTTCHYQVSLPCH